MPYDEALLNRIRKVTSDIDFVEKKMFGGVAFMLNGHMSCGTLQSDLMIRVGKDAYQSCLKQKNVTEMKFTGTPLTGFITVLAAGIKTDQNLRKWIDKGLEFTAILKPK